MTEAAGSAYIEAGKTKLICAVLAFNFLSCDSIPPRRLTFSQSFRLRYGPKPTALSTAFNPKAKLNVEVKFSPFSSGVRRFVPGKVSSLSSPLHHSQSRTDEGGCGVSQDTEASTLAATLHQSLLPSIVLDSLPKSQIDLFVTILESDGWDGDVSMYVSSCSFTKY